MKPLCLLLLALLGASIGGARCWSFAEPESPGSGNLHGLAAPVAVPEPSAQAVRLYRTGNVLWWVSTIWSFAVPAALFFSGVSARLRGLALRANRVWYVSLVIYVSLALGIWFLADLPLDFYSQFVRPHDYGLSSQTFGKWLKDDVLSLLLLVVGAASTLWIPLLLMRRSPRRWWLYAWLAALPIMAFIALIEPIWIEPLFNRFGPMHDKTLEARILDLASKAGVDARDVFEVNKSEDTNELNAYVTGIGATKRIVIWDTTLKELSPAQVEQVVAHEMGHYVLRHVWKGLAIGGLLLLAGLWIVHLSAGWVLRRFHLASRVRSLSDMASLPLLVLLLGAAAFLLTPLTLAVSRHFEREADRFGLDLTHDNRSCATLFVKFVEHDLDYPRPSSLVQFFRASHPSIAQRIDFCNSYHPWRSRNDPQ